MSPSQTDDSKLLEARADSFLSREFLLAIGTVAVEWGMLEHVLCVLGSTMTKIPFRTFTTLTRNPGGSGLAEILRELGESNVLVSDKDALSEALKEIPRLGGRRHEIIHGTWNLPAAVRGGRLRLEKGGVVANVSLQQRGTKYKWCDQSLGDVRGLAEEIAQIRFKLNRALHEIERSVVMSWR